jgi:arginase
MSTVELIGAPTDYGASRRGVDMGPSAIRYAGLADALEASGVVTHEGGDLPVTRSEAAEPAGGSRARFLPEIEDVCTRLTERVRESRGAGRVPLTLGGDHSVAVGSLAGTDASGVVWFDAHGDFNTPETTPSGNVHGMGLAAALGRGAFAEEAWARAPGIEEGRVAWVGLRDVDPAERAAIAASDATAFPMSEIDERGLYAVVEDALDVAGPDAHVSLDLDFLDPNEAPGVGTPVRGGATYREAHAAMEAVAERECLRSMDVVEVNPVLDEHNRTAELAVELVASAFGKRVL